MKMCTRCGSLDLSVKKVVPSGLTFKLRSLYVKVSLYWTYVGQSPIQNFNLGINQKLHPAGLFVVYRK